MADIRGTLEDLLEKPEFAQYEDHWVRAELLVNEIPAHAMDRLRTRFPHVIKLKLPTVGQREGVAIDINAISPEDFCCEFLDFTRGDTRPVTDWERAQIALAIKSAAAPIEAVVVGEEQD
jgi:exonuclease SbcD